MSEKHPAWERAAELVARLLNTDVTALQLAAELGCAHSTMKKLYRRHTTPEQRFAARNRKISAVMTGVQHGRVPTSGFKAGTIRGNAARRYVPVGTVLARRDNGGKLARKIKVSDHPNGKSRNWRRYAAWLWEQANGPVPKGHRIVHADGDRMNDEPSNLVCMTYAEALAHIVRMDPRAAERRRARSAKANRARAASRREQREMDRQKAAAESPAAALVMPAPATPKAKAAANIAAFLREVAA